MFLFLSRCTMLYDKIDELMRKAGVSAYQVSQSTNIPQSAFSRWKSRESEPSLKNVKILAEYFGVSINDLLSDTDNKIKETSIKKKDTSKVNIKDVKVMFYGNYELTKQEKQLVENVIKGVIASRKDERDKNNQTS